MPTKLSMNVKFTVESEIVNTLNHDILVCDDNVRLGSGAKIFKGTIIEAPVLIMQGAKILKDVSIGSFTYFGRNTIVTNTNISRFCSIAQDCQINCFGGHPTNWLSTHPFQYDEINFSFWPGYSKFKKRRCEADDAPPLVTIGPDVWLGAKSFVFGGVQIGAGAIVGAGSLVRNDIAPYGVAVGVPAKIIKFRFSKKIISKLIQLKWWDLDADLIHTLPFDNIEECIDILEK
jgi:virginiamycin A acetyltransferase